MSVQIIKEEDEVGKKKQEVKYECKKEGDEEVI